MAKVLNYGMVGGGPGAFIGDAHRRSINIDGKAKLVAGAFSRNAEKSAQMAEALNLDPSRCYQNYQEMAEKESAREDGIDFVVVVTPNATHFAACKCFLEAGINVVCDKPVTISLAQAEELEKLAAEKGLLFMVTYTYTGHVTSKYIREMVKGGEIGDVRVVMAEYPQGWLAKEDDMGGKQGEWRCNPELSGGVNCLGDLGTHVENIVSMMTGLKVKRVLAKMDKIVPGRVLDDNDVVMVEYDNGATGTYWTSQVAIGSDNSLKVRIFGSKGTILWEQEKCESVTVIDEDGNIRVIHRGYGAVAAKAAQYGRLPSGHTEGWLEAMGNLYSSYIDCVNAKKDGTFTEDMIDYQTVSDGAEGLAFVEACLESSNNGNVWVEMRR